MRRIAAVLLALLAPVAWAEDRYIGTITTADNVTAKSNQTTATPFTIPRGALVAVQCDGAAWVGPVANAATQVTKGTTGTGVKIAADQLYDVDLFGGGPGTAYLSVMGDAAAVNCRVYAVLATGRKK